MNVNLSIEAPVATLVAPENRLDFMPEMFGRHFFSAEMLVFGWMDRLCEGYCGGYWNFLKLSNGGCYLAPNREGVMRIRNHLNYFDEEMSADAVGIVVTLFALCDLSNRTLDEEITERYYALKVFAMNHAEAALISAAID